MTQKNQKALNEINTLIELIRPEKISLVKPKPIFRTIKMLAYYTALFCLLCVAFQNKQNFTYDKYKVNFDRYINSKVID